MKASYKMTQTIKRLEKEYGQLEKNFGVEFYEMNRRGGGFYDYCKLSCKILKSLYIVVAHDGSYYQL